jgi:hypothetical protein
MSSNSAYKQTVFIEEQVRMPSPKSRRATVVRKVIENDAARAKAVNKKMANRPASVHLPDNKRINFVAYRPLSFHFTIRPIPKHVAAAANEPLPAADEPLPAANEPLPAANEPLPAADEPLPAANEPLPAANEPLPAADEPLPAANEPLPAANPPTKRVSKKMKIWRALQRNINLGKRANWAVQFPKRVKRTSNGGHLVLSNHTKRESEKLINAIKRKHKPHKKALWLKPSIN